MLPTQVEFTFWHADAVIARFALKPGDYVIGRDETCGVVIDVDGMAPEQARLRVADRISIEDLGTEEGTFVDQVRITRATVIGPGQALTFGSCPGVLKLEPVEAAVAARTVPVEEAEKVQAVCEAQAADLQRLNAQLATEREEAQARLTRLDAERSAWKTKEKRLSEELAELTQKAKAALETQAEQAKKIHALRYDLTCAKGEARADLNRERQAWLAQETRLKEELAESAKAAQAAAAERADEFQRLRAQVAETTARATAELSRDREARAADLARLTEEIDAMRATAKTAAAAQEAQDKALEELAAQNSGDLEAFAAERRAWQAREAELQSQLAAPKLEAAVEPRSDLIHADTEAALEQLRQELTSEKDALEQRLRSMEEAHAREKRALETRVEQLRKKSRGKEKEPAAPAPPSRTRDLISFANKVLFRKLKDATDYNKENDDLRKELKQRELALVEAWSDRQRMEERVAVQARQLARLEQGLTAAPPAAPQISGFAFGLAAAMMVTIAVLGLGLRSTWLRSEHAEQIVGVVKPTAPQFHHYAETLVEEGRFKEALDQIVCAIALEPAVAEHHFLEGNIDESLLRLDAARIAYARALELNPELQTARANLELCRRILGTRQGAASAESQYALHALMMEQKRLSEALSMAYRLPTDHALMHKTLSAILTAAHISADLVLNADGTYDLDLTGPGTPNLGALRQVPLRTLKLARSEIVDLSPLKGLKLHRLDLSGTRVRDVTPLHGMPLEWLDLSHTDVSNLFPLEGMPLQELVLDDTSVSDLSPLRAMPVQILRAAGTRVWNLQPLAGSPLKDLDLTGTRVSDLAPLKHLPIEKLHLDGTGAWDLAPLVGAPLHVLSIARTEVFDLEPLRLLPLTELSCAGCEKLVNFKPLVGCDSLERLVLPKQAKTIGFLRDMPSLRFLSYEKSAGEKSTDQTAQEFWAMIKP